MIQKFKLALYLLNKFQLFFILNEINQFCQISDQIFLKSFNTQSMKKVHSISSFCTNHQHLTDSQNWLQSISTYLHQSYQQFSSKQFNEILEKLVKNAIKKSYNDPLNHLNLSFIKKWVQLYKGSLELVIRTLILQIKCMVAQNLAEIQQLIKKVKIMTVDTQFQYVLMEVFLLQAKFYETHNENQKSKKSLKKGIQYGQKYGILYLRSTDQIKRQVIDNLIISYFQLFKLKVNQSRAQAIEQLQKASKLSVLNYGQSNPISQNLKSTLKNEISKQNCSKSNKTPMTVLIQEKYKYNKMLKVIYLWQQSLINAQLLCGNYEKDRKILSQSKLEIKLDFKQIQRLKNLNWIQINSDQIQIKQDQLFNMIEEKQQKFYSRTPSQKSSKFVKKTRQDLNLDDLSSSDDSADIINAYIPQPQLWSPIKKSVKGKQSNQKQK